MISGSTLATIFSFTYNIVVARFLGPEGYGQATVVYTLLTLVSALTLSFQLISAKLAAQQDSDRDRAAVYRSLHRQSWACGGLVAFSLILFAHQIAVYLHLSSSILIVLIAIGAGFYVPLGTRRGYVQGTWGFRRLAANLVLEAGIRLGGSFLAVLAGTGVTGVIAANAAASVISWLAIAPALPEDSPSSLRSGEAVREIVVALVFFAGQMVINGSDMVLVKHFFLPAAAGRYAAVALVGRVIYTFSSAVVNSMFPIVAGSKAEDRRSFSLIATSLLLVLGIGAFLAVGLLVVPSHFWTIAFGAGFHTSGRHGLSFLLGLKAFASIVYSLSVVLITYEMSYRIANTSWLQLAFSAAVIAGICKYHSSLEEVIVVQIVLMTGLLLAVGVPFLLSAVRINRNLVPATAPPVRILRHSSEAEAIAEFLKADIDHHAYCNHRETLRSIVVNPSLDNPSQNARRRALFFLRHLALWKELPPDTEWFEVELNLADLSRVRIFPRAHWRRLSRGSFAVSDVLGRIRIDGQKAADPFAAKIASIGDALEEASLPAILLIGVNRCTPLTVIDGNHRLVSAALAGRMDRLRFLCGFSPNMMRCCWYRTSIGTLGKYALNLIRHSVYDPESELIHCWNLSQALADPGGDVFPPGAETRHDPARAAAH